MRNRKICLMGISIDNLSLEAVIAKIMGYIESYPQEQKNRYVCSLNLETVVNTLSCHWSWAKYPELLNTLRNSDIVTAEGTPILGMSRLMGCPINERIANSDLFLRLLETLSQNHKTIYLVGGSSKMAEMTTVLIDTLYPGITIVGTTTPQIDIATEKLAAAADSDLQLIEQINAKAPDVLLISLGTPKQEIWFNRIKHRLKVPVSIGIGKTLEFTFGPMQRGPKWMQKCGLEWLYRFYHDPKHLWQRYILGGAKFVTQAVPLLLGHGLARGLTYFKSKAKEVNEASPPTLFLSSAFSIAFLNLPSNLYYNVFEQLMSYIDEATGHDTTIIDFTELNCLPINQLNRLVILWDKAVKNATQLFAFGISTSMRTFLKMHRLWDRFAPYEITNFDQILATLPLKDSNEAFFHSIRQTKDRVIISFLGSMQNGVDYKQLLHQLEPYFHGQECYLDLKYCSFIDNLGLSFILEMRNTLQNEARPMKIIAAPPAIKRMFKTAKIDTYFTWLA